MSRALRRANKKGKPMPFIPPSYEDIVASKYATAMPAEWQSSSTETRHYFQAIENMIKVFAVRPGEEMLFLTDPLLDRRIVDAITGVANARGVFPREYMAPTTQIMDCPEECRAM